MEDYREEYFTYLTLEFADLGQSKTIRQLAYYNLCSEEIDRCQRYQKSQPDMFRYHLRILEQYIEAYREILNQPVI